MAFLTVGGWKSWCSCDPSGSVRPDATGHYENLGDEESRVRYHQPCGEKWEFHTTLFDHPYWDAVVPYRPNPE